MPSRIKAMSARAVDQLTSPAFVGGVAGLQLVVSPGGTRTWRYFYRLPGDARRRAMKLGGYPALSLAQARERALALGAQASRGEDPRGSLTAQVKRRELNVADAVARYLDACASENAPKTVADKRSALTTHVLPMLGDRSLVDLTRADVLSVLDALRDRPAMRRSLHLYLSHFFGWARERDLIDTQPMDGVKPPRATRPRERVLSDDEIRALWAASGTTATLAKLALLTAQRRGSLGTMRRDQLDFQRREWTIPGADMKSGREHVVPLSDLAVDILVAWPGLPGPFLFGVGSDGEKPFDGWSQGARRLRDTLGGPDWRIHDLRRTAVTLAQRGGCSIEAIRALTQHKTAGVIGVYARHGYADEKRQVVETIERQITQIMTIDEDVQHHGQS